MSKFAIHTLAMAIAVASTSAVSTANAVLTCYTDTLRISQIQGAGSSSPIVNTEQTVTGVVTLAYKGSKADDNVIFIQQASSDVDVVEASRGLAVIGYTGTQPVVGQIIVVQGTVVENYGATALRPASLLDCGQNTDISTLITPAMIPDDANLEVFENMLIALRPKENDDGLYVTDNYSLNRYGELLIASGAPLIKPTNLYPAGSAQALALAAVNKANSIKVDDRNSKQNPGTISYLPGLNYDLSARVGTRMDEVVGVLDYAYGSYRISPTQAVTLDLAHSLYPRTNQILPPLPDTVRVASFNVLNYFNGLPGSDGTIDWQQSDLGNARGADSADEFARQQSKMVSALARMNADVIGILEVENDGWEDGVSAIDSLVDALNASHEKPVDKSYKFVHTANKYIGSDVIKVSFIYNDGAVMPLGSAMVLNDYPFDELTAKHRPPMLQTFRVNAIGAEFTTVVNHFKSKGSSCEAMADPEDANLQGNCNRQRVAAAETLGRYLQKHLNGKDVIILGDLNAYAQEDPVLVLTTDSSNKRIERSIRNQDNTYSSVETNFHLGYSNVASNPISYVYKGEMGALDHALVSPTLARKVKAVTDWHINSVEPATLDYNSEYKTNTDESGQSWDERMVRADSPMRSSDHDPVIIDLLLDRPTGDGDHNTGPTIVYVEKTKRGSLGWPMLGFGLLALAARFGRRRKS